MELRFRRAGGDPGGTPEAGARATARGQREGWDAILEFLAARLA